MRLLQVYFSFLLLFLTSCEEIYNPSIDAVEGLLVVESLFTNDSLQNHVQLTQTTGFYDPMPEKAVSGARVSLIQIDGNTVQGVETGPGYFDFSVIPESGREYKLEIFYQNETYESDVVTMPPTPMVSSFYTRHIVEEVYVNDGYGNLLASESSGRELYVDLPISNELAYYRISTKSILEWTYLPPETGPPPPPPPPQVYGWNTYYETSLFNIAGINPFLQSEIIEGQALMMLTYEPQVLLEPDSIPVGWIAVLDLFGTSKESYEFHEKLNNQFEAKGSLFDPVETQIFGNISCRTDTSKIALGFFDLNSYRQFRYYLRFYTPEAEVIQREIFTYPYIPDHGYSTVFPPEWWE